MLDEYLQKGLSSISTSIIISTSKTTTSTARLNSNFFFDLSFYNNLSINSAIFPSRSLPQAFGISSEEPIKSDFYSLDTVDLNLLGISALALAIIRSLLCLKTALEAVSDACTIADQLHCQSSYSCSFNTPPTREHLSAFYLQTF